MTTETTARAATPPVVETTNGNLRGAADNGVHICRGVRYAESTAAANRFLPPQPVRAWAGVRDALTWAGSAPQHAVAEHTDPFFSWYSAIQPISAALQWVRLNIASFGGDPANVTIVGQSGGASKIAAILAMRAAHGLFQKAIIQSSGGGLRLADPEEAERTAANLAGVLGISRLDGPDLQQIPMDALVGALKTAGRPFRGMIDGRSFDGAGDPFHETAPVISAHVPLLAGCTNTESTYHLRWNPRNVALTFSDISRRLTRYLGIDRAQTAAIIAQYRDVYPDYDASNILIMISSDFIYKRTTYRIAALQAATATAPVYAYLFDRESPIEGGRMRSAHTSEVPFIFGTTDAARDAVGSGPELEPITRCMMATWAAFARTGNPNNPTLPVWKPYNDADRQTMVLNLESRLAVDPGGQARAALEVLPHFGYGYSFAALCAN